MKKVRESHFGLLEDKSGRFCACFQYLRLEEAENNNQEVINAWKLILHKLCEEIDQLLISLKEEIAWSMLDERREFFLGIRIRLTPSLTSFKEYEDEESRSKINKTILLLDDGVNGFRQSFINEGYHEKLFNIELTRYREENETRLENIYQMDSQDQALNFSDETQLKNAMLTDSRKQLFATRFGKIYHDQGRSIKIVAARIIEAHEMEYKDIYIFLDKYLAYEIAQNHCRVKRERVYKNIAFKENVDLDKVIKKLNEFIECKLISKQKHWFIVYKVFAKKKWLKKGTQTIFRDQINSAFFTTLKCTENDFKKIDSYYRKNDYTEWTLEDSKAPQGCETYKDIADQLDQEFQDSKYALPGKLINAQKRIKLR